MAKRGRPAVYDWKSYGNGQTWVCEKGTDFDTTPASFRALVHRTASAQGKQAKTKVSGHRVTFRFENQQNGT
jgi:hypothetical protein